LLSDTDTESHIFNHKNGLLIANNNNNNNFPAQFPNKYQRDQYIMPQQPGPQMVDDSMYREQPQMTRNDWPTMQQQPPPQIVQVKQSNSVWPEKLSKQMTADDKVSRKKGQNRDSEYSEEYIEEGQAEGDDVTTTEAPKKVKILTIFMRASVFNFSLFHFRKIANIKK
jgi:hypothetical protein